MYEFVLRCGSWILISSKLLMPLDKPSCSVAHVPYIGGVWVREALRLRSRPSGSGKLGLTKVDCL